MATLPSTCRGVFFDAGANVGDSLQKWYDAENCEIQKQAMGPAWRGIRASGCAVEFPRWMPLRLRRTYCAHAFEPNERHTAGLLRTARELEARLSVKITIFNGTAFALSDGKAHFGIDTQGNGVGSSLVHRHAFSGDKVGKHQVTVRTVDGVAHLKEIRSDLPLALKLDVEGYEGPLLRNLMLSGVLCQRVHALWVEWHYNRTAGSGPPRELPSVPLGTNAVMQWMLLTQGDPWRRPHATDGYSSESQPYVSPHCNTTLLRWF